MPKFFRVSLAETVTIPSFSEAIIIGNIDGYASHLQQVVVEPAGTGLEKKGLIMGKFVACTHSGQLRLRILNPGANDVKLYKGINTAYCEVATCKSIIAMQVSEQDERTGIRYYFNFP